MLIADATMFHDKDKFLSNLFCCGAHDIKSRRLNAIRRARRTVQTINGALLGERTCCYGDIFGKIFGLLSSVVYNDGVFSDYLGEIFIQCNMSNKSAGQFFTPYHVSKLCAKLAIGTPNKADGKILTLNEPCCGSGGMVLDAMNVLKNDFGINYAMDCFVDC